jgi:protein ImuB
MTVRSTVVWVPDWPVVSAGLAGVPAAVVYANRVIACSAPARMEGVRRGLRRREAQGRCPELTVVEHDPGRDARAFEPVAAAVEQLTPRVEIVRPGLCAFATRGPSRYFGGDELLAVKVRATVPVPCEVGVADGRFAATLAARSGGQAAGPNAGTVIDRGGSPAFLAPFPVTALERPELADLLGRLGVRTLGSFASLPGADVVARFGPDGAIAHRLARGLDERPLAARVPPPDLAVVRLLDPPAERVDVAAFAARALASELHEALAARALSCTRVLIEAETEHGEALARLWRHDGALTAGAIAERVRWQLDGWISSGATTSGLTLIRLVPDEVIPASGRQLGFWGGSAEADDRAGRALARVQGMLGVDQVVTPVLTGGRGPADRIRLVPWGDAREDDAEAITLGNRKSLPRQNDGPWPGQVPAPAPGVVHPEPLPVDVVDAADRTVVVTGRGLLTAEPARVNDEVVTGWAGPWPVDERWWDPAAHRRRARLQVVTEAGAYLIAVEGGCWFIEAEYA